jgi:hypothetical protein
MSHSAALDVFIRSELAFFSLLTASSFVAFSHSLALFQAPFAHADIESAFLSSSSCSRCIFTFRPVGGIVLQEFYHEPSRLGWTQKGSKKSDL